MKNSDIQSGAKRELLAEGLGAEMSAEALDQLARHGEVVRLAVGDSVIKPGAAVRECVIGLAGRVRWSTLDGSRAQVVESPWVVGGEAGGRQRRWECELWAAGDVLVWVGDRRAAVLSELPAAWRLAGTPDAPAELEASTHISIPEPQGATATAG